MMRTKTREVRGRTETGMTVCTSLIAAIITVETALTDGTKTVETAEVPETDGIVRFVWPKEKVPASFTSVTVTPDFATARKDVRHSTGTAGS